MSSLLRVYSYSRCGSCRKAIDWLKKNNLEYQLIEILETPPTEELLRQAANSFGSIKPLFNTSGRSYRELGASFVRSLSDDEAINAIVKDPKLIKRPFLVKGESCFLIGFKIEDWIQFLLNEN